MYAGEPTCNGSNNWVMDHRIFFFYLSIELLLLLKARACGLHAKIVQSYSLRNKPSWWKALTIIFDNVTIAFVKVALPLIASLSVLLMHHRPTYYYVEPYQFIQGIVNVKQSVQDFHIKMACMLANMDSCRYDLSKKLNTFPFDVVNCLDDIN